MERPYKDTTPVIVSALCAVIFLLLHIISNHPVFMWGTLLSGLALIVAARRYFREE